MTKKIKIFLILIGFFLIILLSLGISSSFKPYDEVVKIIIVGSYYFAARAIWNHSPNKGKGNDKHKLHKN